MAAFPPISLVDDSTGEVLAHWSGTPEGGPVRVTVKENASLVFAVSSSEPIQILLLDDAVSFGPPSPAGGGEARTLPLRLFENYAGFCPVYAQLSSGDICEIFSVEVLATKLTAEQIRSLLDYLSAQGTELWRACYSRVLSGTSSAESSTPGLEPAIEAAKRLISGLSTHCGYLKHHHRRRIVPQTVVENGSAHAGLDERSAQWLLSNFDTLEPSDRTHGDIHVGLQSFKVGSVLREKLIENANVYENQVLLSAVKSVCAYFAEYAGGETATAPVAATQGNYHSFTELLREFAPVRPSLRKECGDLLKAAHAVRAFLESLGVRISREIPPRFTAFVRGNAIYRKLFQSANTWYKTSATTWLGEEYLSSLPSLAALYESFCLFRTVQTLCEDGYVLQAKSYRTYKDPAHEFGTDAVRPPGLAFNRYGFARGEERLTLLYQPRIASLFRTSAPGRLVDLSHSPGSVKPYREPDMLLVREAPASPYRFLILDAKYSAQTTVLKARLPDLISKYYCGLGILHPGGVVLPPPLVGLAALHPTVNPGEAVAGPNHLAPEFATDNHLLLVPMVGAVPCMPGHLTELAAYMKEITKRWHRLNFAEDTKPA